METAQQFTLGTLVTPNATVYPNEVQIQIQGRGVFCRIGMEFSFANDNPTQARLFTLERPWNAVLSSVSVNGEGARRQQSPGEKKPLPVGMKNGIQESFQDGRPDIVSCLIDGGRSLRTISMEFLVSLDVLWHKSALSFMNCGNRTEVSFDVTWDLGGLPGAQMDCIESVSDSRFSNLDASRHKWSENITLMQEGKAGIELALDEKKAASICLFSRDEDQQHGCGAVVVVAPVRPQLLRKPVRVAVVVEVRNPQEGLATRDLVDQLSSSLNPTDQISIFLMGSSVTRKLLDWKQAAEVQEDDLAQLLDPSMMGRAQYFWEGFQRVLEDCQDATHVLLSSPGPSESSPDDLVCRLPVFALALGRKPNASTLEDLAGRTGGFLSEQGLDGVDSFLQRLIIRLSPPLLRDFRLEGWGLEKVHPPGATQVYTDKPTVLLGLYDGLLPQTVTLGGLSPAGQKLAQRVRVENFTDFSLMPLFEERSRPRGADSNSVRAVWDSDMFTLFEATRPVNLEEAFLVQTEEEDAGPPAIDMISPAAVEIDSGFDSAELAPPNGSDIFSGSEGAPSFIDDGESLFSNEPLFPDDEPSFSDDTRDSQDPFGSFVKSTGDTIVSEGVEALTESRGLMRSTGSGDSVEFGPVDEDLFAPATEKLNDGGYPFGGTVKRDSGATISQAPTSSSVDSGATISGAPPPSAHDSGATISGAPVPAGSSDTISHTPSSSQAIADSDNRSTVSVNFQIPEWVKQLSQLENEAIRRWLISCPIDHLALALVDTDLSLAETFLSKLDGHRKKAVELQMEWGKLLPQEERESASHALNESLQSI